MLSNILEFHHNPENRLKFLTLLLNTINIFYNLDTVYCIPITTIIFGNYFYQTKVSVRDKKKFILTWLIFSIWTLIGESLIISFHNQSSISYNKADIYNVSSWLFSAYASMVLAIYYITDFSDFIIPKNDK